VLRVQDRTEGVSGTAPRACRRRPKLIVPTTGDSSPRDAVDGKGEGAGGRWSQDRRTSSTTAAMSSPSIPASVMAS